MFVYLKFGTRILHVERPYEGDVESCTSVWSAGRQQPSAVYLVSRPEKLLKIVEAAISSQFRSA